MQGGGTIVASKGGPKAAGSSGSSGVPNDTTVRGATGDYGPQDFESGTMVYNKDGQKESPPYLKHLTGNKQDEAGWTGTMVKPKGAGGSGPAKPAGKDAKDNKAVVPAASSEFASYYKSGKTLEVNENSSLVDLRKGLISLNKAYERELTELDAFYSDKRKLLQAHIAKREKDDKEAKAKGK